jgi:hypothetical protein
LPPTLITTFPLLGFKETYAVTHGSNNIHKHNEKSLKKFKKKYILHRILSNAEQLATANYNKTQNTNETVKYTGAVNELSEL